MSAKHSKRKSLTDWGKVDKKSDGDADTSDIQLLESAFFKNAELHMRPNKQSLTVRLDVDVLKWFRNQGKGYQTKINAILRLYMEAHSK
jgi:uncharacterized protein (DUF4415 family)